MCREEPCSCCSEMSVTHGGAGMMVNGQKSIDLWTGNRSTRGGGKETRTCTWRMTLRQQRTAEGGERQARDVIGIWSRDGNDLCRRRKYSLLSLYLSLALLSAAAVSFRAMFTGQIVRVSLEAQGGAALGGRSGRAKTSGRRRSDRARRDSWNQASTTRVG